MSRSIPDNFQAVAGFMLDITGDMPDLPIAAGGSDETCDDAIGTLRIPNLNRVPIIPRPAWPNIRDFPPLTERFTSMESKAYLLARIEITFRLVATDLYHGGGENGGNDTFVTLIHDGSGCADSCLITEDGVKESGKKGVEVEYKFPGNTPEEAWYFTCIIRVLAIIHKALIGDHSMTIRDIYYKQQELFVKQRTVAQIVDDIASTFNVCRHHLHVTATTKGLVAGMASLRERNGRTFDLESKKGVPMPDRFNIVLINMSQLDWVLIVEKEATFHVLASSEFYKNSTAGQGLLITGLGYPDIMTRYFIHGLFHEPFWHRGAGCRPKAKAFALVDNDPDGLGIMATYKYGSAARTGENHLMNLPGLKWLGVRTSDVAGGAGTEGEDGLMEMSKKNRKKAFDMLKNDPVFVERGHEPEWRAELQGMLQLNVKAEIQALSERDGGLEAYLNKKLAEF